MVHLIFSPERQFFGEIQTEQGKLRGIILNQEGERFIGPQCKTWQVIGIALRREQWHGKPDGTREMIWYMEHVLPRDTIFVEALRVWADEQGTFLVTLENAYISCWTLLARLPFEADEQFTFLMALRNTPVSLLDTWHTCLQEALLLAQHEVAEAEKVAAIMRKRLHTRILF